MIGEIGTLPIYRVSRQSTVVHDSSNGDDLPNRGRRRVQTDLTKTVEDAPAATTAGPQFFSLLSHLPYVGLEDPTQPGAGTAASKPADAQTNASDFVDEIASLIFTRNSGAAQPERQADTSAPTPAAVQNPATASPDSTPATRARDYKSMVDDFVHRANSEYQGLDDDRQSAGQKLFSAISF